VSYWFRNDNRLRQARLAVASYIIVGMIGVLLLGFWKLQVIDADKYTSMAERNRVREIPVIAPRGRMLDRDGRVLVDNRPSFSVLLLRDDPALVEKYLPGIADGIGIPLESPEIPAHHHQAGSFGRGHCVYRIPSLGHSGP
jgi:penicillin-binding protein 2